MDEIILLDAGSGGRASQRLIADIFLNAFDNPVLRQLDDAAQCDIRGTLSFSTDSYTVTPLFFPGGSIGTLAINGTVNDIAMRGAMPKFLSCSFIIEEGLPLIDIKRVVEDMKNASLEAGVQIVTGDTKVVPEGACDKLFINTSGIGHIYADPVPGGNQAKPGDLILINGDIGDHGLTIMAAREDLSFLAATKSDCAPLAKMIFEIIDKVKIVHVLRDPTRGGLATTLNEIAEQSQAGIIIDENKIPVSPAVRDGCSFLGFDPLYLANEGKCICILPQERAQEALQIMKNNKYGKNAAIIGRVTSENPGKVILTTRIGGQRYLGMLEGAQLPRIC